MALIVDASDKSGRSVRVLWLLSTWEMLCPHPNRRCKGGRRSKCAYGGDNSERTWSR